MRWTCPICSTEGICHYCTGSGNGFCPFCEISGICEKCEKCCFGCYKYACLICIKTCVDCKSELCNSCYQIKDEHYDECQLKNGL